MPGEAKAAAACINCTRLYIVVVNILVNQTVPLNFLDIAKFIVAS